MKWLLRCFGCGLLGVFVLGSFFGILYALVHIVQLIISNYATLTIVVLGLILVFGILINGIIESCLGVDYYDE